MFILEYHSFNLDQKGRGSYCLFDPRTDDVLFYLRVNKKKSRKEVESMLFDIGYRIDKYDPDHIRIIVDED